MITIEKGVQMPKGRQKYAEIHELTNKMNVGDSFVVPYTNYNSIMTTLRARYPDRRYISRTFTDTNGAYSARIWRAE